MSRRKYEDTGDYENRDRKRRRTDAVEIEDRLESLIIRVGEKSTSSLESNLEGLASVLEADINNYKTKILKILSECAVKMPEKTTIYTTLVGLLNAKNYIFGGEFVDLMARKLKDALKSCMWKTARYVVRFFADLVNCHVISTNSLLQLYHSFLDTAREDNAPQVRSDTYVYAVLSSLPWVGRELYEKKEQDLERLLKHIEIYVNKRSRKHVPGLRVWRSDDPHPQEEYLDCLWAQVCKLRSDMWQEKHIARPYVAFDQVLCEALQHNVPAITPPAHSPDNTYPFPWVVFRLFDYTDCPEGPVLPGAHSIERYLIEEHLHNIIKEFHLERKQCAAFLLDFPLKHKIPLEYVIVEVVLAEMFHLPSSRYLQICYGSLLIELCKLQPATMPQVLAQAVELLFDRIDTMNVCCHDRFMSWFAYHLSNFQFKWSWDDWLSTAQLERDHPRAKFISEVLQRCIRLSYHERILHVVPEQFDCFLPAVPRVQFRYDPDSNAEEPGWETAQQLIATIRNKGGSDDVLKVLEGLSNPMRGELAGDEMTPPYNPLQIQVFCQSILYLGSKSFSHSFAGVNKFLKVFEGLVVGGEEAQMLVLKEMHSLWSSHQQMMVVLIDKFLRTKVVQCATVANWIFSKEMTEDFTRSYVWEILHSTIRKMSKHVARLQKEMLDSRDSRRRRRGAGAGGASTRRASDESDSESNNSSDEENSRPRPTEEEIEGMEEKLETAQSDQKNLFLIIFQRFIMLLSEHLVRSDTDARDFNTNWYRCTVGRLQQIFMLHNNQVERYGQTLNTLLFTQDLDPHILDIFNQFMALRA
uniref:Nuclear cap-binding protein subunit 1 n=3 Tax=Hirondellea gigas TaxID=1518452 RepID=A0A2P2I8S7_9CRUS